MVAGDLVLDASREADVPTDETEDDDAEKASGAKDRGKGGHKPKRESRGFPAVHVVTEEEAASGAYDINDVVMPLPGVFVQWPQHKVGLKEACRLMLQDGVLADFDESESDESLSGKVVACFTKQGTCLGRLGLPQMPGGYRQLVRQATDVSWRYQTHVASSRADLVDTDADRLARAGDFPCRGVLGLSGPASVQQCPTEKRDEPKAAKDEGSESSKGVAGAAATISLDSEAPNRVALVLEFSLPKSCYATMMLREVCHTPTHIGSFLSK